MIGSRKSGSSTISSAAHRCYFLVSISWLCDRLEVLTVESLTARYMSQFKMICEVKKLKAMVQSDLGDPFIHW